MNDKIIKILISWGIHYWRYLDHGNKRVSRWDGTKQVLHCEPVSGMADIRTWETVKEFDD